MYQLLSLALFFAMFYSVHAQTQLCPGSLGDEIFEEGDFGSGPANVVQQDPEIAPGYIYTTNVPPNDGYYTITNDMNVWGNVFAGWERITDDSNDPQGYFMVVNANFNPGIFYEQVVDGLCENTTYEFSASIINILNRNFGGTLPNVSFFIDNEEFYRTGPIVQTPEWQKVGFTFTTDLGQESAILTLRNNAPGGIGNDLALDNISFRACGPTSQVSLSTPGVICEDDQFPVLSAEIDTDSSTVVQWQISNDEGDTWSDLPGADTTSYQTTPMPPGSYLFRFINATSLANLVNEKCRIISDSLELQVVPLQYAIFDTLCQGLSSPLGDTSYSETGIYTGTFVSSIGCDSIVTLHLMIVPDPGVQAEIETKPPLCPGDSNGSIRLVSAENGVEPYSLLLDGQQVLDDSINVPAGQYLVEVSDRYGCSDEQIINIEDAFFMISGLRDLELVLGYSEVVEVISNLPLSTISWSPFDGLSCGDCLVNDVGPVTNTIYTVVAVSTNGCIDTAMFSVMVDDRISVFFPTAITPNGDGVNDTWDIGLDPVSIAEIAEVTIANRWGSIVFFAEALPVSTRTTIWDGMVGDEFAPAGVYTFSVVLRRADNILSPRSGSITVIR